MMTPMATTTTAPIMTIMNNGASTAPVIVPADCGTGTWFVDVTCMGVGCKDSIGIVASVLEAYDWLLVVAGV